LFIIVTHVQGFREKGESLMERKSLGHESKKEYVKPVLSKNDPLTDITFASGGGGATTGGATTGGATTGGATTGGATTGGATTGGATTGGATTGGGTTSGTTIPGTGGAPGTVL